MTIWSACNSRHSDIENAYIPSEPDYTDNKMWYTISMIRTVAVLMYSI